MKSCSSARATGPATVGKFAIFSLAAILATGCSKSEVQVTAPSPPPMAELATPPNRQTAADRLVEIDRRLAAPITGRADDADQRVLLRAERAALIESGQVPYRMQNQFGANHSSRVQSNPPAATVAKRTTNGDLLNYAPATTQSGQTVVAPNSQARNLSFLEQMTPSERERYYKTLRLQNTSRIEVDVRHHY